MAFVLKRTPEEAGMGHSVLNGFGQGHCREATGGFLQGQFIVL